MARRTKAAAVEEIDEDYEPVEDVKKKAVRSKKSIEKPVREKIEYGAAWLADHLNETAGVSVDAARVRILLRKLTKDGTISRTEAEARARYNFTKGANDPDVKAIVKAVKGGALERAQTERLEGLKSARATAKAKAPAKATAKAAPKGKVTARSSSRAKKAAVDDDLDIDEL